MNREQLLQAFVLANEFKEGDLLVGGTRDDDVRREARAAVSALRLSEINEVVIVEDGVTDSLAHSLDRRLASELSRLTVGQLKDVLLSREAPRWIERYRDGLSSEAIAAVAKVMTNEELALVSRALFNPLLSPNADEGVAIGSPSHFGSRIQPNSPGDDDEEILFSILEGLTYGCGDVILGVNPASDDVETIIRLEQLLHSVVERLELPTRYCVLSDIVKQTSARARTRVDAGFQSLAGTSRALAGMVGLDVDGLVDLASGFDALYFETGQGSAVTNQAAESVDMVTLESRAYGVARHVRKRTGCDWMIVNDVAGFIGPEVFRTPEQLLRACLEDTMMAKLHGLTMGLDVCATFHMGIPPDALRRVTESVVEQAAPAYLMAVAGNADPMLGYLTTSFREHPRLRLLTRKQISTSMSRRLTTLGVMTESGERLAGTTASLYAAYQKAEGDSRSVEALSADASKKIGSLAQRGLDLGYGCGEDFTDPFAIQTRTQSIYNHAQRALYAKLDAAVIRDACPHSLQVRTCAADRDDYLRHPASGEMIRERDANHVVSLYESHRPRVQIVVSDGLNADSVNENLRLVLPPLRQRLTQAGHESGDVAIVITNGRVRAGYHAGQLLDADLIVHLIGERPGTGLNMLSAYLTYGRDLAGNTRWSARLDHSWTTAVCGIHRRGKRPAAAVQEIARLVIRILEQRCSGVALRSPAV